MQRPRGEVRRPARPLLVACSPRFYELAVSGAAPNAIQALQRIGALYAIEKTSAAVAAKKGSRIATADPTLTHRSRTCLREQFMLITQRTSLADAILYLVIREGHR